MSINKTNNFLDFSVFQDELDFKTLENLLETFDHIIPKKISRNEFNNMKGNFLLEIGEDKIGKYYKLFLPEDLKIFELPAIILRINKITFGNDFPIFSSSEELKIKICIIYQQLLKLGKTKEMQKVLKKYYEIYVQIVGEEEAKNLNKNQYLNSIINKNIDNKKYNQFKQKIISLETKEQISDLEDIVLGELKIHFEEVFFEKGMNMLRLGMKTITQLNQKKISDENKQNKQFVTRVDSEFLDKQERFLREKIGIDVFKNKLKYARENGDKDYINKLEYEASSVILRVLIEYPYLNNKKKYGYQIDKILKYKEISCIGFSLLGHSFLSELGIKHNGLEIPSLGSISGHSVIEVLIGGNSYFFDPSSGLKKILQFKRLEKIGAYNNTNIFYEKGKSIFMKSGDPERMLLSFYFNNKGNSLYRIGKNNEALRMFEKAIELNSTYSVAYYSKGLLLYRLGKYQEAIKNFDKAIEFYPNYFFAYLDKGNSLLNLGKNEEAVEMYEIAINLKPNNPNTYVNNANALYKLGRYADAIFMYDKALKLNSNNPNIESYKLYCINKLNENENK